MAEVKNEPETDADIVAQAVDKFLSNPRVQHAKLVDVDMSTGAQCTIGLARSTRYAEQVVIDLEDLVEKSTRRRSLWTIS